MGAPKLSNPDLIQSKAYVNGEWVVGKNSGTFKVTDPATLEEIAELPDQDPSIVDDAIDAAYDAYQSFKKTTPRERSKLLRKWFDLLEENNEDLGKIITWENGKALAEAKGEAKYGASFLEWYAEEAPRAYGATITPTNPSNRAFTYKEPVGVVSIITPWNFPLAMITRKAGAAIAAGCTVVVKPDAQTPMSALALAHLAEKAGFPKGVINVVLSKTRVPEFGLKLCENKKAKKISFTGSTNVGKILMKQSSSTLKKCSFELGGNAPVIIFNDAKLEQAVDQAIASKFRSLGQTCVCANRLYIQSGIYDKFSKLFAEKVANFKVGNGFASETTHGPLINEAAIKKVESQVKDALSKGATAILPGGRAEDLGPNFYRPTVLTGVTKDMDVCSQETFGPLGALIKFDTADEVIAAANDVDHGLAAYVFSENVNTIHLVSERLETGMVSCNTGIFTDSTIPFGGVKESGFGREGSLYGIDDYCVIKTVILGNLSL